MQAEVEEAMAVLTTHFKARVGVLPIFSDAELQRLTMPIQLIMGGRDVLRDAEKIAARLKQLTPHLTTTIISEAGHTVVNARSHILSFLATLSPRSNG